jgi:hypothetical protein
LDSPCIYPSACWILHLPYLLTLSLTLWTQSDYSPKSPLRMLSATSNPDYTTHRSQSTPVPSMIEGIECVAECNERRMQLNFLSVHLSRSDPAHHLTGPYLSQTSVALSLSYALRQTSALVRPHSSTASHKVSPALRKRRTSRSPGFWSDLSTGKWVVNPGKSCVTRCAIMLKGIEQSPLSN